MTPPRMPSEPPVMPDQPVSAQAFDPSMTLGVEGQETGPVTPIVDVDALPWQATNAWKSSLM